MKKRIMALLLSLVLCLSMGSSVMASSETQNLSPTIGPIVLEELNNAQYGTLERILNPFFEEIMQNGITSEEAHKHMLDVVERYSGIVADKIVSYGTATISIPGDLSALGNIDISIGSVPSNEQGVIATILYITPSGTVSCIPAKLVENRIVGSFENIVSGPVMWFGLTMLNSGDSSSDSEETQSGSETVSSRATAEINGEKFGLIIEDDTLRSSNEAETATYNEFVEPLNQAATGEEKAAYLNQALRRYPNANTFTTYEKIDWVKDANVYLPEGVQMPTGGIDVTIADPDVSAGDQIVMLHITKDGDLERVRNVIVQEGSITGHFDSLSPVIYFAVAKVQNKVQFWDGANGQEAPDGGQQAATGDQQNVSNKSASTASKGSPKTGEPDRTVPVSLAVMLATAGIAYFGRRRFCGR